tara:strand:- start:168145 stop:169113 length:969 start_codon:yes stop_codon:yes gene_type:complete
LTHSEPTVLALSGGVGGAKLALGLSHELAASQLQVLVNTADDFTHLGLQICPDIDTLLYTLSGLSNAELGWGLANETWQTMQAMERLGGDTWFRLGDRDMATHLWRSHLLAGGQNLSQVTQQLAHSFGLQLQVLPMSNDPVQTRVQTAQGDLPFQHYFVRDQCKPVVTGFNFEGVSSARPNPAVMKWLQSPSPQGIVICPSNPFVSIDPMLQLPGLWTALRDSPAPVLLISPIVGGRALKGPAAKMMAELGLPVTAVGVAQHYARRYPGLIDCFVIDESDATLSQDIRELGLEVAVTSTVMKDLQHKRQLARFVIETMGVTP